MVHYLCYICSVQHEFDEKNLIELLVKRTKHNKDNNITGLLLYFEGHFVEFIEGAKEDVHTLYNKVSSEDEFKTVFKITESSVHHRKFEKWIMSFPSLNKDILNDFDNYRSFEANVIFKDFDANDNHSGLILLRSFIKQSKLKQLQYQ